MKLVLSHNASIFLEIRDQELRLLMTKDSVMQRCISRAIPSEIICNGHVLNIQRLGKEIKSFLTDESVNNQNINIIIPGLRTICRTLEVPEMPGKFRKKFLEREIAKEMPFSIQELYMSVFNIDQDGTESGGELLLLIGIPRSIVDKLREALYLAGIKKASFTSRPLALTGLAMEEEDALILDMESDELNIIIIHKRQPYMVYSWSLYGSSPTPDVSHDGSILTEIQRSYEYLKEFILKHKDYQKLSCYLTGAASRDEKIGTLIKNIYGLNLELPEYEATYSEEAKSGLYDSALGLLSLFPNNRSIISRGPIMPGHIALHRIHGPPTFIDKALWHSLSYLPYLLSIFLLAYVFYIYQGQQDTLAQKKEYAQRLQSQEKAQRLVLLKRKKVDTEARKIQVSLDELINEYKNINQKSLDYEKTVQSVLDMATEVSITSIKAKDNKLTLEGKAREIQSALNYARRLVNNNEISNIKLSSISAGNPNAGVDYSFTLQVEISKSNKALPDKVLSDALKEILLSSTVR